MNHQHKQRRYAEIINNLKKKIIVEFNYIYECHVNVGHRTHIRLETLLPNKVLIYPMSDELFAITSHHQENLKAFAKKENLRTLIHHFC